jgi:DNA-binding MarR family transcriptional regulator
MGKIDFAYTNREESELNDNRKISRLEEHTGYWLRCLSNFVSSTFESKLKKYGISVAQWVVLRIIHDDAGISLQRVADIANVDKSTISRIVEKLTKAGFLIAVGGKNRRTIALSLSQKGLDLLPSLAAEADSNDQLFFSELTLKERTDLLNIIHKLLKKNDWSKKKRGKDALK